MLGIFDAVDLEKLRRKCLSLPGATEDIKWGSDLCFCVGAKMFCVTDADSVAHGISLKTTPERFAELTERDGIMPARYVGRYHWITIERTDAVSAAELDELIRASYELVRAGLPARVRNQLASGV